MTERDRELAAAKERIGKLERGEFICQKCHLRMDGETDHESNF